MAKPLVHIIAIIALCLHTFISCENEETNTEYVYNIKSNTSISINTETDSISEWTFEGLLTIQEFDGNKIMKLHNLKSGSYSGLLKEYENNFFDVENKELLEPFLVNYNSLGGVEEISFKKNDPVWSMNIKKALGSLFQVNTKEDGHTNENNIFGNCSVEYTYSNSKTELLKEFQKYHCEYLSHNNNDQKSFGFFLKGNVIISSLISQKYSFENDFFEFPTEIDCHLKEQIEINQEERIYQQIHQSVQLKRITKSPIQVKIDHSKFIYNEEPLYEIDDRILINSVDNKNTELKKLEEIQTTMEILLLQMEECVITNEENFNTVGNLHKLLSSVDLEELQSIYGDKAKVLNIIYSMISTLGSENSLKFIDKLYVNDSFNTLVELQMLAKFPLYFNDVSDKIIEHFKESLDFENVTKLLAQETLILSFANLVHTWDSSRPSNELEDSNTNVKMYCDRQAETNNSRLRASYIVGLGNMEIPAFECLVDIAKNKSENTDIRTLAMYSLNPVVRRMATGVFPSLWPILKNNKEPYDLRIATLNVLLRSVGSAEQYFIFQYLNQTVEDVEHHHLYNYFYSFIQSEIHTKRSCQKVPDFYKELREPLNTKGLLTGYYHFRTKDSKYENNYLSSLDVSIVANPLTGVPEHFIVTIKEQDSITIAKEPLRLHFKVRQFNKLKKTFINNEIFEQEPIKLLQWIIKSQFLKPAVVEEDFHLEIILFSGPKAIFMIYSDDFDSDKKLFDYVVVEILKYIAFNNFVHSSVNRRVYPTLLGTEISSVHRREIIWNTFMGEVFFEEEDILDYFFSNIMGSRTAKLDFELYNPFLNIRHGISKIKSTKTCIKLNITNGLHKNYLEWEDSNTSFDFLHEYKHAMYIETDENFVKHCPNCKKAKILTQKNSINQDLLTIPTGTKDLILEIRNCSNLNISDFQSIFLDIKNWTNPQPIPIVMAQNLYEYIFHYPPFDSCVVRLKSEPDSVDPYYVKLYWNLNSDEQKHFNISISLVTSRDNSIINEYDLIFKKEDDHTVKVEFTGKMNTSLLKSSIEITGPMTPEKNIFCDKPIYETVLDILWSYEKYDKPSNSSGQIKAIYSISEDLLTSIEKNDECAEEIKNSPVALNHTPATRACYKRCARLSTYDLLTVIRESDQEKNPTNLTYKLYDYGVKPFSRFMDSAKYRILGTTSTCVIAPQYAYSFKEEKIPPMPLVSTMIALIQCNNHSDAAIVVSKTSNNVYFKMWYKKFVLEVTHANPILEIPLGPNFDNSGVKITYFGNSNFQITTDKFQLYYNSEYIRITMDTKNMDKFCGFCTSGAPIAANRFSNDYSIDVDN